MFHFFFLIWVAMYFLPSIIGWRKHNAGAIVMVNLLLGWTVVGWFVALVWALSEAPAMNWGPFSSWQPAGPQAPPQQPQYQPQYQAPYQSPQPQTPPVSQPPQANQQTPVAYCSHCGSSLRAGDRFCAGCGSGVPHA